MHTVEVEIVTNIKVLSSDIPRSGEVQGVIDKFWEKCASILK
jgi:hypothetical protein